MAILHFGTKAAAHGTSEMPMGGDLLRALSPCDSRKEEQCINKLVGHIKSLQAK